MKSLCRNKSIMFLSMALIYLNALGQVPDIKRHILNQIDIRNQNWNISQNKKNGLIYFANSEGLIEYNGILPKLYRLPYDKSVRSVFVDDDGTIFTGTFEEIGFWKIEQKSGLTYHSLSSLTMIEKNDDIWKIYKLNNQIYFQSFSTVYIYDYSKITAVKPPFTLLFMFPARNRFIAQVIDQGMYWFDGNDFTFIEESSFLGSMKVHSVIERSDGSLFIGTASHGIYRIDGKSVQYWDSEISDFLKQYTCNAGLSINDSLFVYGSILNGVVICNTKGEIINHFNLSNGLQNNTVLSLQSDNKGLWIGFDEGVNYINILSPVNYYANTSGRLGTIYSVFRREDELLLGTNHGLFTASISSQNENYSFSNITLIPKSQGQVWFLNEFNSQVLCGHNDGTFIVESNRISKISDVTGGWSVKSFDDKLIEGTYTGLVVFEKDERGIWKFRNKIEGYSDPTRHIEVDYLGYIWAAHAMKGVFKIELNENLDSVIHLDYFDNISRQPHNIDVFNVNNRILLTTSEDIFTYDYIQHKIIPFTPLNEQLGEYRQSKQVIPYKKNQYFFVQDNKIGLFEVSINFTAQKLFEIVQENSNIPERDIQIISLDDHTILIPDRLGFSTYNTHFSTSGDSSALFIYQLAFSGKKKNILYNSTEKQIKVAYNMNNLTCYFADPSRFDQKSKSFLYRLPDMEEEWHSTTLDNFTYLNLKWGSYRIQIKPDVGNRITETRFSIKVPWYLSWVAFLVYFVTLLGLIYLGIRIFRFELAKQKQLLEYEVNKNKLENELNYKDQELLFTMRYLIQKNEILTELKDQIDSLKDDASRYPVKFVKSLEKIIHEGLESQTEEWKNAIGNLKLSEQGFFKKLIEYYPNLTPNDLKLCSYLRMNFSTKEIAKLLNISARGVEISRYRLRKKMNLNHDINLTEFLMGEVFDESERKNFNKEN